MTIGCRCRPGSSVVTELSRADVSPCSVRAGQFGRAAMRFWFDVRCDMAFHITWEGLLSCPIGWRCRPAGRPAGALATALGLRPEALFARTRTHVRVNLLATTLACSSLHYERDVIMYMYSGRLLNWQVARTKGHARGARQSSFFVSEPGKTCWQLIHQNRFTAHAFLRLPSSTP